MINNLKKKFIIVSGTIITTVVSIVFIVVNSLNYYNVWRSGGEIINKLSSDNTLLHTLVHDKRLDTDNLKIDSSGFIISVFEKDNINYNVFENNISLNDFEKSQLVQEVLNLEGKSGYVDNFRYLTSMYDNQKVLYLVDVERELKVFKLFLFDSLIVAVVIILITIILLSITAKRIVAPLEENIKKQKQFITYASHELKTPLAIISSNADVLSMEKGESKWANNIRKQVNRLSDLISSLIEFSKAEEKEKFQINRFSLSDLVVSRIEDFEELASFKSKKIIENIEKNVYYNGNHETITQVIDILLDNAIKYSDEDSDIIVNLLFNKNVPNLVIKNRSRFIKKGDLSNVFDRFYRLENSADKTEGHGLGLALAKLIIDRHNSKIKAYSLEDGEFIVDIKFLK